MKKLTDFRKAVEAGVDSLQQMRESVVRPEQKQQMPRMGKTED